jgi:undecaprenyl-phosphate galactose phosphotransferase
MAGPQGKGEMQLISIDLANAGPPEGSEQDTQILENVCPIAGWCGPCHSTTYKLGKRIFDLALAIALLPVVAPLCLLLIVLIKLCSAGPVFYKHLRVGQYGRRFHLYKFRTMALNNEQLLANHLHQCPEARPEWARHQKLRSDPRVTPLGAILRRTSLDELPQVLNVILGDMSFVGPRPIVPDEAARYGDAFAIYEIAKPGMTGLWQVSGRGTLPYENRISLDVEYVLTWSLILDLKLVIKTFRSLWTGEGAY